MTAESRILKFTNLSKLFQPPRRQTSIPEPTPVPEQLKEEARKVGRYVLPKPDEHDELVFDRIQLSSEDEKPVEVVMVESEVTLEKEIVVVEEETLVENDIREVEAEIFVTFTDEEVDVADEVQTAPVDDFEIINVVPKVSYFVLINYFGKGNSYYRKDLMFIQF